MFSKLLNPVTFTAGRPLLFRQMSSFSYSTSHSRKMLNRFKPKKILNFDNKGNYLLYSSEFARPARARLHTHPRVTTAAIFLISFGGASLSLHFGLKLFRKDVWQHKLRVLIVLLLSSVFFKSLRRSYTLQRVIKSVSLRPDGESLEIACHFPYSFQSQTVNIKDVKFLKEDDLARKLRSEELFIEMRCTPVISKGQHLNMFIDGSIMDQEVLRAVSDGRLIDTSNSVHPETL